MHPLAVTISASGDHKQLTRAAAAASRWSLPLIPRRRKAPLEPMLAHTASAFLVFGGDGIALWDAQGSLRFTPGMARLRVKRLDAGADEDLLVRLAELRAGDSVLDCTLGLGADAIVAARAVGPSGRVLGVEKSTALAALVAEGLRDYQLGPRSCAIDVHCGDSLELLRAQPDASFDVVVFDPMFEKPRRSSPAFDMLRRFADYTELTSVALEQARRVARRWVLVKGARYTQDLKKLGLTPETGSRTATVAWARARGGCSSASGPGEPPSAP
jgi:16S rRNA (guanine1516-N2)-methyltransferase